MRSPPFASLSTCVSTLYPRANNSRPCWFLPLCPSLRHAGPYFEIFKIREIAGNTASNRLITRPLVLSFVSCVFQRVREHAIEYTLCAVRIRWPIEESRKRGTRW